jgi:hypothetical protein
VNCRVMRGAWEEGQHKLVVADMRWKVEKVRRRETGVEAVKWGKLSQKKQELVEKIQREVVWSSKGSAKEMWCKVSSVVKKCCREVLGVVKGGQRRVDKETWWWNESVQQAVRDKKVAFKKWKCGKTNELMEKYKTAKKLVKREVAEAKCRQYQEVYDRLSTKEGERDVYRMARQRCRGKRDVERVKCVKDEAGKVLVEDGEIGQRWERYFCGIMNEGVTGGVEDVETRAVNSEGSVEDITLQEVESALRKMKSGKAVGPDDIPVDIWRLVGKRAVEWLHELFRKIYAGESMPEEWRSSWVIPLYKGKGDVQECKNYRGIKLLSHTMKLWERVIEGRLRKVTKVGDMQFGFVQGKSTTEPVFMLRQMMEKYRRQRKKMHVVFVDLEKAYDRVPRELLWEVLEKRGVSERYISIIKDMYRGARSSVRSTAGLSGSFEVKIGVHQGSALSPYLFILVLDELLRGEIKEAPWCMLFADDMVLIGESEGEVEAMLAKVRAALEDKGLKINRDKTEYMESRWKGEQETSAQVKVQESTLKKVSEYKYLGSYVQEGGEIERDVNNRIQAGWAKWREASGVLCDRRVPMKLKGKFYATVVRPVMLYASECWALKKREEQKIQVAEMRMLRLMSGVTRQDRIRNEYVRSSLGVDNVCDKLAVNRLRWFGHVVRKDEGDVVKRVWRMNVGDKMTRGRPEITWMQVVKKDMKARGVQEEMAIDRREWRQAIHIPTLVKLGHR